jgi:hypothetical protein
MERIPSGWLLGSYHVMARIEILCETCSDPPAPGNLTDEVLPP